MAFMKLCNGDSMVEILRDIFEANILQTPQADVQPLGIVIHKDQKTRFWGDLKDLLVDELPEEVQEVDFIQEVEVPDLSGRKSREADLNLGLKILSGFLKGFSLPTPEIEAKFRGDLKLHFSFKDVKRRFVQPAKLGRVLIGNQINKYNPAANIFFGDQAARLFIIDSVIMSNNFSIHIDNTGERSFKLESEEINKFISGLEAGIQVNFESELDIQFKATTPLAFAFTCLDASVDVMGKLLLSPSQTFLDTKNMGARDVKSVYTATLFYDEPGMISWDEV